MRDLIVLGLLTASTHWLVARSEIARPIWSRARGWLGRLLACTGCSGWWLGLIYGLVGVQPVAHGWRGVFASGVLGTILTPMFEALLLWGLRESTVDEEPDAREEITPADRPPSV